MYNCSVSSTTEVSSFFAVQHIDLESMLLLFLQNVDIQANYIRRSQL